MRLSHKASKKNKKKKPSFRKLLKTSNLKLENKQKNRQFKQQSSSKKQRKEQRKLRQAITDVSHRPLKPLERYKKKPGERNAPLMRAVDQERVVMMMYHNRRGRRGGGRGGVPGVSACRHDG